MKYLYYLGAICGLISAIFVFAGFAVTNYIIVGILWLLVAFDLLMTGLNE